MKIYIASDHGGFELKKKILTKMPEFIDIGPTELDPDDDYPLFVDILVKKVLEEENSVGILICRSGIGVCIAANKYKGIYASLCFSPEHAKKAKEHNNANVLCLDSDYEDFETHTGIIDAFLHSSFEGWDSRHGRRVRQIKDIENRNFK